MSTELKGLEVQDAILDISQEIAMISDTDLDDCLQLLLVTLPHEILREKIIPEDLFAALIAAETYFGEYRENYAHQLGGWSEFSHELTPQKFVHICFNLICEESSSMENAHVNALHFQSCEGHCIHATQFITVILMASLLYGNFSELYNDTCCYSDMAMINVAYDVDEVMGEHIPITAMPKKLRQKLDNDYHSSFLDGKPDKVTLGIWCQKWHTNHADEISPYLN